MTEPIYSAQIAFIALFVIVYRFFLQVVGLLPLCDLTENLSYGYHCRSGFLQ